MSRPELRGVHKRNNNLVHRTNTSWIDFFDAVGDEYGNISAVILAYFDESGAENHVVN